jgi:hypothetical protein
MHSWGLLLVLRRGAGRWRRLSVVHAAPTWWSCWSVGLASAAHARLPGAVWSRGRAMASVRLDSRRPLVLFAKQILNANGVLFHPPPPSIHRFLRPKPLPSILRHVGLHLIPIALLCDRVPRSPQRSGLAVPSVVFAVKERGRRQIGQAERHVGFCQQP